jgi:hypothetical protein
MSEGQLTLFAEDSPAKTLASQESDVDLMANGLASGTSLLELSTRLNQRGWSLKTCQGYSLQPEGKILPSSFSGWQTAGMAWGGECLTLKASDLPSDGSVCLLSQVLEAHVDARYYLSPKACAGIIRRANVRGKQIPQPLLNALMFTAGHGKSEAEEIQAESAEDTKCDPEDLDT